MADRVKIYEIAKAIGISSTELIEVCQRGGHADITHHSQAVAPARAEEIRKTAIRLYKPKRQPALKPKRRPVPEEKPKPAKAEKVTKKRRKRLPPTRDVKPVQPPTPKGLRVPPPEPEVEAEPPRKARPARPRRRKPEGEKKEEITKRTIVFKQPKRVVEKRHEEKIEMMRPVSVRELSERLGIPVSQIIRELMFDHGTRANINQTLEDEVVQLIGLSHEVEITLTEARSAEDELLESLPVDSPEDLVPRPPVVTLLGHVDHGKTTILDRIRNTRVAESEAGGITQDIGAWQVQTDGRALTFIDTPGHEAFTAMRARGAKMTDLVVLVVAADDGVMPQTVEAIDHARAADVLIMVAINKMDRLDANPARVLEQLAGYGLTPESWGGDVGCVEVSGLMGNGIAELLERIALEAELLDVKANPNRAAIGAVLEARIEGGRGVVTDIIVQNGTLRRGDIVVCGNAFGTVRSLFNDRGEQIQQALPSQPISLSGLNQVPEAGDTLLVVDDLETARKVAEERHRELKRRRLRPRRHVTLENLYESIQRGEMKRLNAIVKADVQGTLDPLVNSLSRLGDEEVSVRIIHSGIGRVNRSDVLLADASDAIILAFRVGVDEKIREMAADRGIEIVHYAVIYEVSEQIRNALEGLLEPEQKEERVGLAEVRQIFRISRFGTVAGCHVAEGAMRRNARIRVIRDDQVTHQGVMASLRQEKNDVREVVSGRECGINIEGFNDIKPGDRIECFTTVTVKRKLAAGRARQPVESQGDNSSSAQR